MTKSPQLEPQRLRWSTYISILVVQKFDSQEHARAKDNAEYSNIKSPTDRDNGQLNRRHIQSTLLYPAHSISNFFNRQKIRDQTIYHRQYIQKQLDKEKGWTMKAEAQLTSSAGPVYAFACNAQQRHISLLGT